MKKRIWITFGLVLILTTIFFYLKSNKVSIFNKENLNTKIDYESNGENLIQEKIIDPDIKKMSESLNTYFHKKYNFSFDYPSTFKTSNFIEGDGEQIQFQSDNGDWFQIYVTPWDEGDIITPERIKKDLPNIVIKEPQQVILGPKQKEGIGPRALIFFSKDVSIGDTREIWFVHNGSLYQISTYKSFDIEIGKILSTLVFQN